jgi:hypothetical protein
MTIPDRLQQQKVFCLLQPKVWRQVIGQVEKVPWNRIHEIVVQLEDTLFHSQQIRNQVWIDYQNE